VHQHYLHKKGVFLLTLPIFNAKWRTGLDQPELLFQKIFFLMGSLFFLFDTELEEGTVNNTPIFGMIHEQAI